MRSLGGLTLLTGIGVALFVYLPTPVDSGAALDRLQRIVASRFAQLPRAKVTLVSRLGAFSPSIALSMPAQSEPRHAGHETTAAPAPVSGPSQVPIASELRWVGRRSFRQRRRRSSLRHATPVHAISLSSRFSRNCAASAATGAAWTARGNTPSRTR